MDFTEWKFTWYFYCSLKNPTGTVVSAWKIYSLQIYVVMELSHFVLMFDIWEVCVAAHDYLQF